MSIPQQQRDAAINVLQRIRSKVLDTEKRLLLDQLDHHHVVVRASEIQGQAELLALSVLDDEPAQPAGHEPGGGYGPRYQ